MIVIGIVIYFVGDALRSLLNNRREIVLSNLDEANKRIIASQEKLVEARSQFEAAQKEKQEIQNQSLNQVTTEKTTFRTQTQEIIQKLEKLKKETLLFQQQKTLNLLSKKVIQLSLKQVQEKLQNRVDLKFQTSIDNFYIALLRNYESLN